MKVAISCDHILERNSVHEVIEIVLEIFEDAEIYTLAHKEKAVLGPIELRRIHSTYLSRICSTPEDLYKNSFLIPGAAKSLYVPCSVDLLINISEGLSHGIKTCEKTKVIHYLYQDALGRREAKSIREKIFRKFLLHWSEKSIMGESPLWVSTDILKEDLGGLGRSSEVLPPSIKIDDFPLFPEGLRKTFPYDFYLINTQGLDVKVAKEIVDILDSISLKYKFIGFDEHLESLKTSPEDSRFFGERCAGELAPLVAACLGLIDFGGEAFPLTALKVLATGRPVLIKKNRVTNSIFATATGVSVFSDIKSLKTEIKSLSSNPQEFEAQKLRAHAMKFHNVKFKSDFKRRVDKALSTFSELASS